MIDRLLSSLAKIQNTTLVSFSIVGMLWLGGVGSATASGIDGQFNCPNLPEKAKSSELNQPAYQGKEGWFFRESDLNHLFALTDANVTMLKKINASLKLKNIKLFLLPVPTRGLMGKDYEPSDGVFENRYIYDEIFAEQQFRDLLTTLKSSNLGVVDVLAYLDKHPEYHRSDFYLLRDIHWTTTGSLLSAKATAETLLEQISLDKTSIKNFVTEKTGLKRKIDSPTNLILNQICNSPLPFESLDAFETKDKSQTLDSFLADDATQSAPIALVGTSFSVETFAFHFSGFLRSELHADVSDYALTAGGLDQSLFDWAHGDTWQKSPPQAVLWEIPYIDRLPNFPESSARQIVPALGGLCAGTLNAAQELTYNKQSKLTLNVSKKGISGSNFYLASDLSDASMRAPTFKLTYDDSTQEEFAPHRPDRVLSVNKLFWELSDLYKGNLKTVEIEFEPGKTESGTLAICKYPDSVTQ